MNFNNSSFLFNAINDNIKDYGYYFEQSLDLDNEEKCYNSNKYNIKKCNFSASESLLNQKESSNNLQLINDKCQSFINFIKQNKSCPIELTSDMNKKWMKILITMFDIQDEYLAANLNQSIKLNLSLKISNKDKKKIEKKQKLYIKDSFCLFDVLKITNSKISKLLKKCVRNGIPDSLRGVIWKTIIDPLDTDFEVLQLEIIDKIRIDNENNIDDDSDECKKSDSEHDFSSIYYYSNEFSNSNYFQPPDTNSKPMLDMSRNRYSSDDHAFNINLINYLSNQACSDVVEEINKDINRTLIQFPQIQNEPIKKSLKNILAAYSVIDKDLGYTQGMAFIAGLILFYMDEYSAFSSFCILMLSKRFRLRDFFIKGFPRVNQMNKIWQVALKEYFPKIYKKLNSHNVDPIIYTLGWWMTAFTCFPFDNEILLFVFDCFLLFGSSSLISFGLTIIGICYDYLLKSPIDDVISLLQSPCNYSKMNDFIYVQNEMNKKYIVSKKTFNKFLKKAKTCQ